MGSSIGRVDDSIRISFERIREQFKKLGIEGLSDRQVSKVMNEIFEELDFKIIRKVKKRKDKFEITL